MQGDGLAITGFLLLELKLDFIQRCLGLLPQNVLDFHLVPLPSPRQLEAPNRMIAIVERLLGDQARREEYGGGGDGFDRIGKRAVDRISRNDEEVALPHIVEILVDEEIAFARVHVYEFIPIMQMVRKLALRAFRVFIHKLEGEQGLVKKGLSNGTQADRLLSSSFY